ncbi:hypothetical protein OAE51_01970 [bacterium]|nr:hypothetical protein [bacterium]
MTGTIPYSLDFILLFISQHPWRFLEIFGWNTLGALKPMLLMPFFGCGKSRTLKKLISRFGASDDNMFF